MSANLDAASDLHRFFDRGGKLIVYHGWSDSAIPPQLPPQYYQAALKSSGSHAKHSMGLFMIPGFQHCAGGPGPTPSGAYGSASLGETPDRDWSAALHAWVETGRTPDSIIGSTASNSMTGAPPSGSTRQRLLCAYPALAMLKPGADPDQATSYSCREPGR